MNANELPSQDSRGSVPSSPSPSQHLNRDHDCPVGRPVWQGCGPAPTRGLDTCRTLSRLQRFSPSGDARYRPPRHHGQVRRRRAGSPRKPDSLPARSALSAQTRRGGGASRSRGKRCRQMSRLRSLALRARLLVLRRAGDGVTMASPTSDKCGYPLCLIRPGCRLCTAGTAIKPCSWCNRAAPLDPLAARSANCITGDSRRSGPTSDPRRQDVGPAARVNR